MHPPDQIVCPKCGESCASALGVISPMASEAEYHCACGMTFSRQKIEISRPLAANPYWVDCLLASLNGLFDLALTLAERWYRLRHSPSPPAEPRYRGFIVRG